MIALIVKNCYNAVTIFVDLIGVAKCYINLLLSLHIIIFLRFYETLLHINRGYCRLIAFIC